MHIPKHSMTQSQQLLQYSQQPFSFGHQSPTFNTNPVSQSPFPSHPQQNFHQPLHQSQNFHQPVVVNNSSHPVSQKNPRHPVVPFNQAEAPSFPSHSKPLSSSTKKPTSHLSTISSNSSHAPNKSIVITRHKPK